MAMLKSNVSSHRHRNVEHRYYFQKYTPSYATLCKMLNFKSSKNSQIQYALHTYPLQILNTFYDDLTQLVN